MLTFEYREDDGFLSEGIVVEPNDTFAIRLNNHNWKVQMHNLTLLDTKIEGKVVDYVFKAPEDGIVTVRFKADAKFDGYTEKMELRIDVFAKAIRLDKLPDGMIGIWEFGKAPEQLRELSGHGGDEDWVVLVPAELKKRYIPFFDNLRHDLDPEITRLADGSTVYIYAN